MLSYYIVPVVIGVLSKIYADLTNAMADMRLYAEKNQNAIFI